MAVNRDLVYPRPVFRTTRALSVLSLVFFLPVLTLVILAAVRSGEIITSLTLMTLTLAPVLITNRIVKVLHRLEQERADVDEAMVTLFDLGLVIPPVVYLAVMVAARLLPR